MTIARNLSKLAAGVNSSGILVAAGSVRPFNRILVIR